ncbi:acetyl/propionyl/methylcrotonyl-CoA carboxylase subunit alpha [Achromobacter sp. PD1]|uniref:acetyl/propionyl/methylcrotonyl-CoA carboxylase subunit alpha n=1 Tax=Achromobacter sp. PD1 TaxID=3399125 RepID=UPI003AF4676F
MTSSKLVRPFHTLLIANRGEIARRIMRGARKLGYRAVAVYSDADADSLHVREADLAVRIGGPAPADSYLNIDALLAAARASGADAVHPGYGFLAENEAFAAAAEQAGLVFVGPPAAAIGAMGNKARAKAAMGRADVPCIPGYQGTEQGNEAFVRAASEIGFPVMVKAAAGGGGRGMRLVRSPDALPAALASARSEAATAFGSDELILEKAIERPRHVEIQVLADSHGNVIHLGERDCSVQRRHQKIIEEAPSPAVDAALRASMGQAAVRSARALGYQGAGTMEFLLAPDGRYYFMEMNTRLQVEHAVTEAVTGLDLVEWQLRVAAGEMLDIAQAAVRIDGHAMELRLTAEDVPAGFLPQTGVMRRWRPPQHMPGLRVDHGLMEGGAILPYYDSMIAKLVAHGRTREEACRKLRRALEQCVALGVPTNQSFLADCLNDPVFAAASGVHTGFVEERFGASLTARPVPDAAAVAWAAFAVHACMMQAAGAALAPPQPAPRPWHVVLALDAGRWEVALTAHADAWLIDVTPSQGDTGPARFEMRRAYWAGPDHGSLEAELDGIRENVSISPGPNAMGLFHRGRPWEFQLPPAHRSRAGALASGTVTAPFTGRILHISVAADAHVNAGDPLIIMEAMKMEHTLYAPVAGRVADLAALPGSQASKDQPLLRIAQEAALETAP